MMRALIPPILATLALAAPAWGQDALTAFADADANGDAVLNEAEFATLPERYRRGDIDRNGDGQVSMQEYLDTADATESSVVTAVTSVRALGGPAPEALRHHRERDPQWPLEPFQDYDLEFMARVERETGLAPIAEVASTGDDIFRILFGRQAIEVREEGDGSASLLAAQHRELDEPVRFRASLTPERWSHLELDLLKIRQAGIDAWSDPAQQTGGRCREELQSLLPVIIRDGTVLPNVIDVKIWCTQWGEDYLARLEAEVIRLIPGCEDFAATAPEWARPPWGCIMTSGDRSAAIEVLGLLWSRDGEERRPVRPYLVSFDRMAEGVTPPEELYSRRSEFDIEGALKLSPYFEDEMLLGVSHEEVVLEAWSVIDGPNGEPASRAPMVQTWRRLPEGWRIVAWEAGAFEPVGEGATR